MRENFREKSSLHKKIHWRMLKEIARKLIKRAGCDVYNYNLDNICCYEGHLAYSSVNNTIIKTNHEFQQYEIPNINNRKNHEGNYFIILYDKDENIYISGILNCKISYGTNASMRYKLFDAFEIESENNIKKIFPRKEKLHKKEDVNIKERLQAYNYKPVSQNFNKKICSSSNIKIYKKHK